MNKKIIAGIVAAICIVSAGYFISNKNNAKQTTDKTAKQTVEGDFKAKSAYADVDLDMVIQDKDPKDDDASADYVFLAFTCDVADSKKDDDSNPFNVKSYKLDGNPLPKNTTISTKNSKEIIIKLPNEALKGVNSSHSVDIAKTLLDKNGKKIQGDLSLKLPYSNSSNASGNNSAANNTSTNTNKDTNKDAKNKTQSSTVEPNANMPKYTIELGKAIPLATVVLVKLDTKEPENYKVTVDGVQLEPKKNSNGENIFISPIKKVYEMDEVKKLIKIEKIK